MKQKKKPFIWGSAFNKGAKSAVIINKLSQKYGLKLKDFLDSEKNHTKKNTIIFNDEFYSRGNKFGIDTSDLLQLKTALKYNGRLTDDVAFIGKKKNVKKWGSPFQKFTKKGD